MKTLVKNIGHLMTMASVASKDGRFVQESNLDIVPKGAMVLDNGKIIWIGAQKNIPKIFSKEKKMKEVDFKGKTVLPGFVECHTHTLFAGSRAAEFEMRNQGVSYQEIAAKGGGILSTMRSTRSAKLNDLVKETQSKVDQFVKQGVTTLEIKTGYALDQSNEIKCLKAINKITGPHIVPTYLGAHAIPKDFSSEEHYINFMIEDMLPRIKKLTNRIDIYIEKGFFSKEQAKRYLDNAKELGFQIVIHADQFTLCGGADLAVELNAMSADHVIQIQEKQIHNLAKSETTAVLLPAADLYMKCAYPPARKLIDAGAKVALATDFNPGSCPTQDLNLVGLLARLEMKMSLPEVIAAYTFNAASALGLQAKMGSLEVGKDANFISINADWTELFYHIGQTQVDRVFILAKELKRSN